MILEYVEELQATWCDAGMTVANEREISRPTYGSPRLTVRQTDVCRICPMEFHKITQISSTNMGLFLLQVDLS